MSFKLKNGKVNVNIKFSAHIKRSLIKNIEWFDKNTNEFKKTSCFSVVIRTQDNDKTFIKVPTFYCKPAPWEYNKINKNKDYILTIDPKKEYRVYKLIQGDEVYIQKIIGEDIIKYFDEEETIRKSYKERIQI